MSIPLRGDGLYPFLEEIPGQSSFRQQAEKSYISLTATTADSNAAPGSRPNYHIAYRISTVHDC
jgi:hypothetical protein